MRIYKFSFVVIVLLLVVWVFYSSSSRNPYPAVRWIEDYPGATGRYATYTPVLAEDESKVVGPTVGADYGKLTFEDVDDDGLKEAIIETKVFLDWGELYQAERFVLKYRQDNKGLPSFSLADSTSQ
jgi:hypothetical protein